MLLSILPRQESTRNQPVRVSLGLLLPHAGIEEGLLCMYDSILADIRHCLFAEPTKYIESYVKASFPCKSFDTPVQCQDCLQSADDPLPAFSTVDRTVDDFQIFDDFPRVCSTNNTAAQAACLRV